MLCRGKLMLWKSMLVGAFGLLGNAAMADTQVVADLGQPQDPARWEFFTDGVMGGVSTGQAVLAEGAISLRGQVSTQNNGGFIQARLSDVELIEGVTTLTARVRGNGQTYYLHLRTRDTVLPWHYYQAAFTAGSEWGEVDVPLSAFRASHRILPDNVRPERVSSVALVAYGRDHEADVSLSRLTAR